MPNRLHHPVKRILPLQLYKRQLDCQSLPLPLDPSEGQEETARKFVKMEVTPTTIAMATHTTTCGGSDGHGLQMKTAKERMVEESQLNKHLSSVLEEQNGEKYPCEEPSLHFVPQAPHCSVVILQPSSP